MASGPRELRLALDSNTVEVAFRVLGDRVPDLAIRRPKLVHVVAVDAVDLLRALSSTERAAGTATESSRASCATLYESLASRLGQSCIALAPGHLTTHD